MTEPTLPRSTVLAGRYRIGRELGKGGMATVFLAHDQRHDREVAVKVVHAELAATLGVDRFLAEVRITAKLQHPNILPLLDSGVLDVPQLAGGRPIPFYVMPFVPGESLRQRLARERQLPIGDALAITRGVASALAYAHRHGVIHRDIKPENILLVDGQPVVADFGIALAVTTAGDERLTQTGLSLGTPQYMSPEQVMGERHLDGRTDQYALGVVTYEMLAGEPPFTGANAQAIVARVLTERPRSIAALRDTVTPQVDAAVQQALAKLPADRFATAADFADALTGSRLLPPPAFEPGPSVRRPARRLTIRETLAWALAAAATGVATWAFAGRDVSTSREQWDLVAPETAPIVTSVRRSYSTPAISVDGTAIAYAAMIDGTSMLYMSRLGSGETRPLSETHGGYAPFFSDDGRSLGFLTENQVRRVDLATGKVTVIREGIDAYVAAWTASDRIVYIDAAGYAWIQADGSGPIHRLSIRPRIDLVRPWPGPTPLPGSDQVIVSDLHLRMAVVTLSDGSIRFLTENGAPSASPPSADRALSGVWPRFVRPGYLVFWRPGAKMLAVRFDPRSLRVSGTPVEMQRGVRVNVAGVSPAGTWAYSPQQAVGGSVLAELADSGVVRRYAAPARRYQGLALNPDGRRLAMRLMTESGREVVEVYDFARLGAPTARIEALAVSLPRWDHTGRYLYTSSPAGMVYRVDTRRNEHDSLRIQLARNEVLALDAVLGDTLLVSIGEPGHRNIFAVRFADSTLRIPVVQQEGDQYQAVPSTTRRWIAYAAAEGGSPTLVVDSWPPDPAGGSESRQPLRIERAANFTWDTSDNLYFIAGGEVLRTRVTAGPHQPKMTPPVRVATAMLFEPESDQPFAPFGDRLMALVSTQPATVSHLTIVRNLETELARLFK